MTSISNSVKRFFFKEIPQPSSATVQTEQRGVSFTDNSTGKSLSYQEFVGELEGRVSSSGIAVNSTNALAFPVVYACINVISETLATLPIFRNRVDEEGNRSRSMASATDIMFATNPNAFQTWFDFKYHLMKEALSTGNGYARIVRNGIGECIELQPLSSYEVSPFYIRDGYNHYLYYYVHGEQYAKEDVIHIKCLGSNGVIGQSPIQIASESIGAGLAQQNLQGSIAKNGLNLEGVLSHPATISDAAARRLKAQMEDHRGSGNAKGTLLLEEGLLYNRIAISPHDAQLLEALRYSLEDVARMYRVPLHKLQDLQRSTNNNIEHQSLEFYTDTMSPWIERIEQELDMKLLYGKSRTEYKHEFDVTKLLRIDSKSRSEYHRSLFNMAAITPNQIRKNEGMNASDKPEMDDYYLQLAQSKIENLEKNNGNDNKTV